MTESEHGIGLLDVAQLVRNFLVLTMRRQMICGPACFCSGHAKARLEARGAEVKQYHALGTEMWPLCDDTSLASACCFLAAEKSNLVRRICDETRRSTR